MTRSHSACSNCLTRTEGGRFCGRCGAVLVPADRPGRRWSPGLALVVLVLAATAWAALQALPTSPPADDAAGDVDLGGVPSPVEEGSGADARVGTPSGEQPHATVRAECLGHDCIRWRVPIEVADGTRPTALADGFVTVATARSLGEEVSLQPGRPGKIDVAVLTRDGQVRWRVGPFRVTGSEPAAAFSAGPLVVVALGEQLLALDVTDGAERWRTDVVAPPRSDLAVAWIEDGLVVVHTERAAREQRRLLQGLDPVSGRLRWEHEVETVSATEHQLVAASSGVVTRLDPATGQARWQQLVARRRPEGPRWSTPPRLSATAHTVVVAFPGAYGEIIFLDAARGDTLLRSGGGRVIATPHAGAAVVVAETFPGRGLTGYLGDGEVLWRRETSVGGGCCALPQGADRHVLLTRPGVEGHFEVVDASDGTTRWEGSLSQRSSPMAYADPATAVFREGRGGGALAMDLAAGDELWRTTGGAPYVDVLEGLALVATEGELLALALTTD
jgi:outer membrane protein assembly factor BamB